MRTGWVIVALLAVGVAAAAVEFAGDAMPSLAMMWLSTSDPKKLPRSIQWASDNSWVALVIVMTPFFVAFVSRRWLFEKLASRITIQFSPRVKGWTIIAILIFGATALVRVLTTRLIDVLESTPGWVPLGLFVALLVILWSFRGAVIGRPRPWS